jgi:hypothetical protein
LAVTRHLWVHLVSWGYGDGLGGIAVDSLHEYVSRPVACRIEQDASIVWQPCRHHVIAIVLSESPRDAAQHRVRIEIADVDVRLDASAEKGYAVARDRRR